MGHRNKDGYLFRAATHMHEHPEQDVWTTKFFADLYDAEMTSIQGGLRKLQVNAGALAHIGPQTWRVVDREALELYLMGVDYCAGEEHKPPAPKPVDTTLTRCPTCWEDRRTCEIDEACPPW